MSLPVVGAAYALIFISELPDKTMFASVALATRGRPVAVWVGAAAAFAIHVGIAVTVGAVFVRLFPARAVQAAAAALFLGAGIWALHDAGRPRDADATEAAQPQGSSRGSAVTAFTVVFLAEWGDLTQLLTADLAAKYHAPLSVGLGAGLALWSVAALAVLAGRPLARLPDAVIRRITGLILLGLAALALAGALSGR